MLVVLSLWSQAIFFFIPHDLLKFCFEVIFNVVAKLYFLC